LPPGISQSAEWPSGTVQLGDSWSLLLYTDGLIEGKVGPGPERLGSEGLMKMIEKARAQGPVMSDQGQSENERLIDSIIDQARELNGEDLDDDLAMLLIGYQGPAGGTGP
jgi:serine phosphatase RsbU (regulator of sigma subunit)